LHALRVDPEHARAQARAAIAAFLKAASQARAG
jgi:hypothetical protein